MFEKDFRISAASSPLQWLRIYCLYRASFPRYERKPFSIICSMCRRGKTDVWYCEQDGRFAGLATTINDEGLVLLDYLAVAKRRRGSGIGSRILREMKRIYAGKGIFVEIESEFEDVPNKGERVRRKKFYVSSGMLPSHVMASVFGVKMELLCWNCRVDFQRYHSFYRDNYSQWTAQHITEERYPL